MKKNYSAFEAANVIMGNDVKEIAEVGGTYPLFARTVSMANSGYVLDLLKAIPKVTVTEVEAGLCSLAVEDEEEVEETKDTPKKSEKKTQATKSKKAAEEPEEEEQDSEDENDYESMTSKALYKLCCDRGISSKCKKRDKASLIAVLKENDGEAGEEETDDWGEEEEEDPYKGKTAKELFKMCTDRGIKTKPKQSADAYVKLLKKADEEAETEVEEEDDDDDWEI